ncbi:MAG: hypothetical protein A2X64_07840 [Ignavibacteria bacterium GWF2_33_9]|nr:MAG: hypothetical protein A2X64_07840 [Ignavibacteria bacterium GWF2_33_9]
MLKTFNIDFLNIFKQKNINFRLTQKLSLLFSYILLSLMFTSCINLREDYPEINYYGIKTDNIKAAKFKAEGLLQVRPFGGANLLSERRFMVETSEGKTDKYYYHRWSDDFQELFTWEVISQLSKGKYFTDGIVNQGTALIPDYILEGDILSLRIYNDEDNRVDSSFVELQVKINLISRKPSKSSINSLYTNDYTQRITRKSNKALTISAAVSKAAEMIITQIGDDIVKQINQ